MSSKSSLVVKSVILSKLISFIHLIYVISHNSKLTSTCIYCIIININQFVCFESNNKHTGLCKRNRGDAYEGRMSRISQKKQTSERDILHFITNKSRILAEREKNYETQKIRMPPSQHTSYRLHGAACACFKRRHSGAKGYLSASKHIFSNNRQIY